MIDKRAKKLIEQFLSHNPEARLDGSFENIKSNSWFNSIDWDQL
jgi:cGMP-dependent protein kinase